MKSRRKISGVIIVHIPTNKILILQKHNGEWDLPKGNCERGETFLQGARREAYEETGLKLTIVNQININHGIKIPTRFYLALAEDTQLPPMPNLNINPDKEHINYKWVDKRTAEYMLNSWLAKSLKAVVALI